MTSERPEYTLSLTHKLAEPDPAWLEAIRYGGTYRIRGYTTEEGAVRTLFAFDVAPSRLSRLKDVVAAALQPRQDVLTLTEWKVAIESGRSEAGLPQLSITFDQGPFRSTWYLREGTVTSAVAGGPITHLTEVSDFQRLLA
ncbi:hypothetical protein [Deinococcus multiflagellatus]|uniref:Uncharacterized protein n=1 Tax=Deinococcus multiflagellatus TaxID=1656887 RepID=A0ABW1ZQF7_9DEIO|nr:hypothetical protein [Deinococcus multiflagellatus]MBZ9715593.1 hypothetical protein [Deinococcus multiflagellatus]